MSLAASRRIGAVAEKEFAKLVASDENPPEAPLDLTSPARPAAPNKTSTSWA